jgi:hypothetical protein
MGEPKITLVLSESDANLLAAAVGAGAVSWDMQGAKDKAKRAMALRERIKAARRYDHGSATRQSTRLMRRRG